MIILHKDNPIYQVSNDYMERFVGTDRDNKYTWNHIGGFYYKKFEHLFKSLNLDYKLAYYEDYPNIEGEYFFGRFAHAPIDKEQHEKYYYELEKRFDNIWPDKLNYNLYDDKVKQYQFLESLGYSDRVEYQCVNTLEELYHSVDVGKVVKSTYGAGSGNVFLITEKKYCEYNELIDLIKQAEVGDIKEFFPAIVQPMWKGKWYKLHITNEYAYCKLYDYEHDFSHPLNFGIGHPALDWTKRTWWMQQGNYVMSKDELKKIPLFFDLLDIKKKLNTPNVVFDIIEDKILEFSTIYTEPIPAKDTYGRYNINSNLFEEVDEDMEEISYYQTTSVLKEFNLI